MFSGARHWACDYCPAVEFQPPPRGADVLPTPPVGWSLVDITKLTPAHSETTAQGKVKVGDARDAVRTVVCPACAGILKPLEAVK